MLYTSTATEVGSTSKKLNFYEENHYQGTESSGDSGTVDRILSLTSCDGSKCSYYIHQIMIVPFYIESKKNNPPKMGNRNIAKISIRSVARHHIWNSKVRGSFLTLLIKYIYISSEMVSPLSSKIVG